jgi:hypothetical protein
MPPSLVAIFFVFAGLWLSLVAYAESSCPLIFKVSVHCSEGAGPAWFLVMVTSPVGGFTVLGLVLMAISGIVRSYRE